jgi:ABC-type multidrug transport system fused ATPase/permease subunit
LTSFVFYLAFVQGAIYDVGDQWSKIQDALGSAREVFNLLDREPQLRVTRQPVELQAVEQSSTNGDSSSSSSSSVAAAAAAAAAGIQFNDGECTAYIV